MKVAQQNHRIIANNIANADTPGYNPVSMDFQATLRDAVAGRGTIALRRTDPRHLDASRYQLDLGRLVKSSKNDYNKVDIEEETAKLAQNRGRYTQYAAILTKQFSMVKNMLANDR
jgi:flagellar basal-body rod protein FlgB